MSSSVASTGEQTAQQKFNPSWMRSAFNGGGGSGVIGSTPRASAHEDHEDVAAPMVSNYSYDREKILSLIPKGMKPPKELLDCPFFVDILQLPVVDEPLSEHEERLQHNINSSKAMSSLSQSDRIAIAAGGVFGGGYANGLGQSPNAQAKGGWTPVKSSWSKSNNTPDRPQRGRGGFVVRGGRTLQAENGASGPNASAPATPDDASNVAPFGKYGLSRRGGTAAAVGRGGSTTAAGGFNSRAEGLYNPRDPSDRPKPIGPAVTKSESGDEDDDEGGWSTVGPTHSTSGGPARPAWGRSESWNTRSNYTENAWSREGSAGAGSNSGGQPSDRAQMLKTALQTPLHENASGEEEAKKTARSTSNESDLPSSATDLPAAAQPVQSSSSSEVPGSMQFSAAWSQQPQQPQQPQPSASMTSLYDLERIRLAAVQQQQQNLYNQMAQQNLHALRQEPVTFYYVDPTDVKRGPFGKDQMVAWFKAGYFTEESLKVQRGEHGEFKTIGELLQAHGKLTPFDYPEDKVPAFNPSINSMQAAAGGFPNIFGNPGIWGAQPDSLNMYGLLQSTIEQQVAAERQRLIDEHNRRTKEEAEKFQQMQEMFVRQLAAQKEMGQNQLREKENALLRHKEELQRREMEMKEHALELQKKLENEKKQLEDRKRAIEMENAKKLEEERRRNELEAIARRTEETRLLNELKAMEDRKRRAEEAAEMERRRLAKESEEAARKIMQIEKQKIEEEASKKRREVEARDRRIAEELAKKEAEQAESEALWAAAAVKQISSTASEDSEDWTTVQEHQPPKEAKHTKVAPWAAAKQDTREKTLKEIQMEEERQLKAEQERLAKLRKEEQAANIAAQQPVGNWAGASARLQWNGSGSGSSSAWGSGAQDPAPARAYVSPLLDGPSLEAANKIQPVKKASAPAAAPAKQAASKPAAKAIPSKKSAPVLEKSPPKPSAIDGLTTWFGKRFKQLSSSSDEIDTNMLFSFVMDLENPNEVEDIVMSYLDESKAVKEFVREFLKKRIEMKTAGGRPDVDDLSSARTVSAAPSDGNSSSSSGVQGKKKKKNQKTVLDGNILGFRGAAASDRLNKGEIDAIPTAPVNPSRR